MAGNGKSYLYVQDCIDAMLLVLAQAQEPVNIFNLGTNEYCTVDDSLGWICAHLGVQPRRSCSGGSAAGSVIAPSSFLIQQSSAPWAGSLNSAFREGVIRTLEYLQHDQWVLQRRA